MTTLAMIRRTISHPHGAFLGYDHLKGLAQLRALKRILCKYTLKTF